MTEQRSSRPLATCPAPEQLVPIAAGDTDADRSVAKHVAGCETCRAEIDAMREAMSSVASLGHMVSHRATPDCLDEIEIADFVEGLLDGAQRVRAETHISDCARCRAVARATAAMAADPAIRRATPDTRGRRVWISATLAGAAAAALLLMVIPQRDPQPATRTMREPAVTSAIAPVTLAPRGAMQRIDHLAWSRVPGAQRYRVRVQSGDGAVVWSAITEDSSIAFPDSVRLQPATYFWRVEAQTEWRRWVASELTRIVVERAP